MSLRDIRTGLRGAPQVKISVGMGIVDALVATGICASKREAREFVGNGANTVNGTAVTDAAYTFTSEKALHGELFILRRGKKKFYLGTLE